MRLCALSLLLLVLCACTGGGGNAPSNQGGRPTDVSTGYPPTVEGARDLLREFLAKDANVLKLRSQLKPTLAELEKIYQPAFLEKAEQGENKLWPITLRDPDLKRDAAQTEVLVYAATTAQLAAWQSPTREEFGDEPKILHKSNFARVPQYVLEGLTFYRFKFVKPGEKLGAVYAALLVHVNGRWVLIWNPVYLVEFHDDIMARK